MQPSGRVSPGATTDATGCYVWCRYGNVNCVEALIQASNHETNDDDVEGKTPLLLACQQGHHQAVQVLLALGGDVTKRLEILCLK